MTSPGVTMDRADRRSNYDRFPSVQVPDAQADAVTQGWSAIGERIRQTLGARPHPVVAAETYPGVNDLEILSALCRELRPALMINAREAFFSGEEVDRMIRRDLTDDRVFGRMSLMTLVDFLDTGKQQELSRKVADASGLVLVYGTGATLISSQPDLLIYADMARWEIQLRQRRGVAGNLFFEQRPKRSAAELYKHAYFLDWRLADRHKRGLFDRVDFFLDTHQTDSPKLVAGAEIRRGLRHCVTRPFRVVPFFDPGPWGGQWMKTVCDLDRSQKNFAWCFDCVPEENSLLLGFGRHLVELPSIDLVFQHARELLGDKVFGRFGNEFPIRFDFLDTIGGGNLSLQVHPLVDYIQQTFGMHYTQDESYYMLDADEQATVYLGLKENVDRDALFTALREAQADRNAPFDAERYVNRWPARRHDHFLIPAGTIHCSGKGGMVLEISATPYIFTFKLWDWGRLGLDGKPRPIHIDHGEKNIQFDRTTGWVQQNLINNVCSIASGDGWTEQKTGLHETQFIETRRHWFTGTVPHNTNGGVNVLNLVEGEEALVESPSGAFDPMVVHYAETFIVPASVGAYTIRPLGATSGRRCGTVKAFVKTQA